MKKIFLLMLLAIVSTQLVAESYQRWVYWVSPTTHEVTASEMTEITSMLYDNKIVASKEFSLSSGVRLKIPQPTLYLKYIEKAVRAANPAVFTKDDIIFCLNDAEKMRWGNDISGSYKNYYYSYAYKSVRAIENFSGEGKDVDFLFINGIPAIKCDCGNPIEDQNPRIIEREEEEKILPLPENKEIQQPQENPVKLIVVIRNSYQEPNSNYRQSTTPPVQIRRNRGWVVPVCVIGGVSVAVGVGYLIYALTRPNTGGPGGAPLTPPSGPGGTPPGGGGGPGGAPL
jgi:hypothetical protein